MKDAAEIARMERAAAIADAALCEVLPMHVARASPRSSSPSSSTRPCAAAGPRASPSRRSWPPARTRPSPTTTPVRARIARGDPVVVDFGATFEGYRSDMTRTFCVGAEPDGDWPASSTWSATSQAAGAAAVRAGHQRPRRSTTSAGPIIADAGWADRFEHGTGHGVGLDIHEAPTVSQLGTAILAPGFVVTVEPGVYLPGHGGVRVEDTLVVTEDGSRPLTRFTKDIHGSLD